MTCWRVTQPMQTNCAPAWTIMLGSLASHLTCWRLTARSILPAGRLMRWGKALSMWLSPNRGPSPARQAHEHLPWFRSGRNWRTGIESRISLLKRPFGLRRCRYHGENGMQRWVGWGIIAYDLWAIARKTAA